MMQYHEKPERIESGYTLSQQAEQLELLLTRIREELKNAPVWRCKISEGDLTGFGMDMTGLLTFHIDVCPFCNRCQSYHYAEEEHILSPGQTLREVGE